VASYVVASYVVASYVVASYVVASYQHIPSYGVLLVTLFLTRDLYLNGGLAEAVCSAHAIVLLARS